MDGNRNQTGGRKAVQGSLLDDVGETDSGNSTDSPAMVKNVTSKAEGQNVTSSAHEILPAVQGQQGDRPVAKQRTEAKIKDDEEPRHHAKDQTQPEMGSSGEHEATGARKSRKTATEPNTTATSGLHHSSTKEQDPASPGETLAGLAVEGVERTHPNDQNEGISSKDNARLQQVSEQESVSPSKETDVSAGAGHAVLNGNGSLPSSAPDPRKHNPGVSNVTGDASVGREKMIGVAAEGGATAQKEAANNQEFLGRGIAAASSSTQSNMTAESGDVPLHGNGSLPKEAAPGRSNKTAAIGDASGHGKNSSGVAAGRDAEAQEEAADDQEVFDKGDVDSPSNLADVSAGAVYHGNGNLSTVAGPGRTEIRVSNVTGDASGDGKMMDDAAAEMDSQQDAEAVDDSTQSTGFENNTKFPVVTSGIDATTEPIAALGGPSKEENLSDVRPKHLTSSPPSPHSFPVEPKHGDDDEQGAGGGPTVAIKRKGDNRVGMAGQVKSPKVDDLLVDTDKLSSHSSPPPPGLVSFKSGVLDAELMPMKRVSTVDTSAELRETKLRGHPSDENGPKKTADDTDGSEFDKKLQQEVGKTGNEEDEAAAPADSAFIHHGMMATPLPDILGIMPKATLDAEFRVTCSAAFVDTHENMLLEDTAWINAIIAGTAGKMPIAFQHCDSKYHSSSSYCVLWMHTSAEQRFPLDQS